MTSAEFRLDVPIAHSLFEFHSGLGGGATGNRHDGKGWPMCVAWLANGNCHLGLYRTDFYVCCRRHPEALAFFLGAKSRCLNAVFERTILAAANRDGIPFLASVSCCLSRLQGRLQPLGRE